MHSQPADLCHQLWVPAIHRDLTGGREVIEVHASPGADIARVISAADVLYPGLRARLVENGRLRQGIVVAVDGEVMPQGLSARLEGASEIHFVRAAAGG
jgi:sulfur carrier protein ThiS